MPNPTFREFLTYGEAVEKAVEEHLLSRLFPFCKALPIGSSEVWRGFGADFVLHDELRNRAMLLEIKADFKTTGNIAIETFSVDRQTAHRTYAWLYTSKADYVLYVGVPQRRVLILEMGKLRGLLAENKFPQKSTDLNRGYVAYFYLIPWEWALVEFPSLVISDDEWPLWEATIQQHIQKE